MARAYPDKVQLVEDLLALKEEDFLTVMCTIAQRNPYPNRTSYITNKFQKARKDDKGPKKPMLESSVTKLFVKPIPPKLTEGRLPIPSSRADKSSYSASLLPDLHGTSVWKVPIVFRGDLVPTNGLFFLDVEKLSMKTGWGSDLPYGTKRKYRQVANNLSIVDQKGTLIMWAFIQRDPVKICQYFTSLHRIDRAKVEEGVDIATVCEILGKCLATNKLVGLKVNDDLKSLSHESEFCTGKLFNHENKLDLQDFFVDSDYQPIKLKDLATHFELGREDFQNSFHASVKDARMHMKLYFKMIELQNGNQKLNDTSELNIKRSSNRKYFFDKNDVCKCKFSK